MRTYKTLGGGLAAILLLILTQLIAQGAAGLLAMIKLPAGVCNIISGILYAGLGYAALRLLSEKVLHEHTAALGMPKLHIQPRWAITAVLLPLAVTGCYLLLFRGTFVRADMRGDEMFSTLSAGIAFTGIAFTGIAAGFVEEMVFRGVILNLFAQRWNKVVAVIVPSLLFGIVHILGADFTFGSCLLVILTGTMVGVMFSLIALQSGSVWNSGIVHAVWNIVIIGGGLSIGETADAHAVVSYVLESDSFAVTGGQFGIEASVISLAGYCIVAVIAYAQLRADNEKRS